MSNAAARHRSQRVGVRLALVLAVTLIPLLACGGDDADTPAEVDRYCERYRAYLQADRRAADETDGDRAVAAAEAARQARVDVERATPPSLQDEADTIRSYQLMSGQDRAVLENRLDYELATDRVDAYRTDRCTLG